MKNARKYILMIIDIILINFSYALIYFLKSNFDIHSYELLRFKNDVIIITGIYLVVFCSFRLYKKLWKHITIDEAGLGISACIVANLLGIIYGFTLGQELILSVNILGSILSILLVSAFRMSFIIIKKYLNVKIKEYASNDKNKLREVDFEDLLGRDPVKLDMEGISHYINARTVMVTGGGGSIGSELCRQIIKFNPKELIVLDEYENNAYVLQQEFNRQGVCIDIKYVIASVRDKKRLNLIFNKYKPDIVFHAAAHKHVPLMEENPSEAIKNNVFGTLNVVLCSDKYKVKRFVMISTDKAVNPTNIMGATKRVCEMIIQSMNKRSSTQFVAVRFGNVLGSNGSVIPVFIDQIKNGGPVTVTHKEINRFFMTIPEAAQLVLQAGAYAKGGEIFVLDMESPVKIYDLACYLIRLMGYEPNKDIKIEIIGLRPGEKLYEEVLTEEEGLNQTLHNKIFVGKPTFHDFDTLMIKINEFNTILDEDDREKIISKLEELVPTYKRFESEAAISKCV
ncbi:polysaccharide biosynthesis protein [Clostridium sp. P21]|uniref:Polysaccharide biosynthesis protein n=1 Tax=Clostridium muellerianum TaxID=2716538 RepID=A0A7Y0HQD3_9CLOT|nr:nucleoside-diphosphate sugar epimerase/dehydratase [Clostridium muellerianum]NMM65100.1 polysaccharide biosynthesis protein [Clostridium muellerianum]